MVMGKYWPYITPEYLSTEMDYLDLHDRVPFLTKEEWNYCFIGDGSKQAISELEDDGVIHVKRSRT